VYVILFGLSPAPFVDLLPGSQGRVKIYKDKAGGFYACAEIARELTIDEQPGSGQDLQG
jgi:hypothetical protein